MNKHILLGLIAFFSSSVYASNIPPVAVISSAPNQIWFYNVEDVVFTMNSSYDTDGYINYTKWYINGVFQNGGSYAQSMSKCFALDGSPANECYQLASGVTTVQVKLEVRDNQGEWSSQTKTYTIQVHKGRKYFVKDHLGNIRTTVNRDGNVLGYDDYYPFGLVMPGRSSNSANPNDNYKFTGHERDDEAGINLMYAGARYSDPILGGRWLSIDPLASKYPSWSPYNYVMNNPINAFDPDGRDVWFVHGTFSSTNTWSSRDGTIRYDDLWANALNDQNAGRFSWRLRSKLNTSGSRTSAAKTLARKIKEAYDKNPEMLVQIVAHSHGGNVAIKAANILYEKYGISVDRLFLLGTPSRDDFTLTEGAVSELINFWDNDDSIQRAGGFDSPFGNPFLFRLGLANRTRPEDENASEVQVINENGDHHSLHTKQEIIDWVKEQLEKQKEKQ